MIAAYNMECVSIIIIKIEARRDSSGAVSMEAISAARLLGTKVVLTGVQPIIAQTLVHLGIDLSEIETRASLAAGLRLALDMLDLEIVDNKLNFQGINLEKRVQL